MGLLLALDPGHEEVDYARLARGGYLRSLWDLPPFREASTAAAGTGVLGLEDGMPAHRRLASVVGRVCGREARAHEVLGVTSDRPDAFLSDVSHVLGREVEPRPELRLRQPPERCVVASHAQMLPPSACVASGGIVRSIAQGRTRVNDPADALTRI